MQGVTQTSRQASTFNARFTVRVCLLRPVSDGLQLSLKNVGLNNYTPYIFFSTLKNVAKHRHKKVPCHFLNSVFREYRVLGSTSHYRIFAIFFSPAGEIKTYQDGFLQHVTQFCLHRNASPYTDITQQCFPTMSPAVPFWLRKTNTGLYILADVNTVSGWQATETSGDKLRTILKSVGSAAKAMLCPLIPYILRTQCSMKVVCSNMFGPLIFKCLWAKCVHCVKWECAVAMQQCSLHAWRELKFPSLARPIITSFEVTRKTRHMPHLKAVIICYTAKLTEWLTKP